MRFSGLPSDQQMQMICQEIMDDRVEDQLVCSKKMIFFSTRRIDYTLVEISMKNLRYYVLLFRSMHQKLLCQ